MTSTTITPTIADLADAVEQARTDLAYATQEHETASEAHDGATAEAEALRALVRAGKPLEQGQSVAAADDRARTLALRLEGTSARLTAAVDTLAKVEAEHVGTQAAEAFARIDLEQARDDLTEAVEQALHTFNAAAKAHNAAVAGGIRDLSNLDADRFGKGRRTARASLAFSGMKRPQGVQADGIIHERAKINDLASSAVSTALHAAGYKRVHIPL
ncbi:MAG: hypothetical protein EOO27_04935 [Comamonadaceae bacterium]|nr:MAG: hypothetical protein EOO27_04935 [Comamonadaceae bacterium]